MKSLFGLTFICCLPISAFSPQDFKLHPHKDYLRKAIFWEALEAGFASIEVDVILKDGGLMVAQEAESVKPELSLKSLYLEPIRSAKTGRHYRRIWVSFTG